MPARHRGVACLGSIGLGLPGRGDASAFRAPAAQAREGPIMNSADSLSLGSSHVPKINSNGVTVNAQAIYLAINVNKRDSRWAWM